MIRDLNADEWSRVSDLRTELVDFDTATSTLSFGCALNLSLVVPFIFNFRSTLMSMSTDSHRKPKPFPLILMAEREAAPLLAAAPIGTGVLESDIFIFFVLC